MVWSCCRVLAVAVAGACVVSPLLGATASTPQVDSPARGLRANVRDPAEAGSSATVLLSNASIDESRGGPAGGIVAPADVPQRDRKSAGGASALRGPAAGSRPPSGRALPNGTVRRGGVSGGTLNRTAPATWAAAARRLWDEWQNYEPWLDGDGTGDMDGRSPPAGTSSPTPAPSQTNRTSRTQPSERGAAEPDRTNRTSRTQPSERGAAEPDRTGQTEETRPGKRGAPESDQLNQTHPTEPSKRGVAEPDQTNQTHVAEPDQTNQTNETKPGKRGAPEPDQINQTHPTEPRNQTTPSPALTTTSTATITTTITTTATTTITTTITTTTTIHTTTTITTTTTTTTRTTTPTTTPTTTTTTTPTTTTTTTTRTTKTTTTITTTTPAPTTTTIPTTSTTTTTGECLCLFDIDRTVTGRQRDTCGGANSIIEGVHDPAYGGGPLTLSALGSAGVGSTFCGGCRVGFVSAGSAGGRREKERLASGFLGGRAGTVWSGPDVKSPLVTRCHDSKKARCARGILEFYRGHGADISEANVFFFDDKASSVRSFQNSGMNAHQVSCRSRDADRGGCGASPREIQRSLGVAFCR